MKSSHETESKEELGDQNPCKLEHQKEKDMASSASCTFDIEPEKIDSQELPNTESASEENLQAPKNCTLLSEDNLSSHWHISKFTSRMREFWEPPVPEGKTRVRWKCVSTYSTFNEVCF